jgi:predicted nuclease of predicted toxin-antitoxin system
LKVLLDTCVWGGVKTELEASGYDVIWAGDWDEDPGDEEILARAHREERILVTLDKDFGELAIVRGQPHSGIIRLVNLAARQQGTYCLHVLKIYKKDINERAIITVDRNRVRIRSSGD